MEKKCCPSFCDQDILTDVLTTAKQLSSVYALYLTEISDECVFDEMEDIFLENLGTQREVFLSMNELGFYPVEKAEEKVYQKLIQEFNKCQSDIEHK